MNSNKKWISLLLTMILTVSLAACGTSPTNSAGLTNSAGSASSTSSAESVDASQYILKLGHCWAVEDNFHIAATKMADEVYEKTNGAVKIDIYPASQLGSTTEQIEAVVNGYQDIAGDAINTLDSYEPLADIESYPWLFESEEQALAFLDSDLCDELLAEIGGDNFVILGAQYRGARMLQTTKPVYKLADLKGLKLRTASMPILNFPWEYLGCATTTMSFNEVYAGLQQGTVEGQENPLQTSYVSGLSEVEKYVMNTQHVYGIVGYFFSKKVFDSLPAEYQTIIREAADASAKWRNEVQIANEAEYVQLFIDAGCTYIEVEDLDEWKTTLAPALEKEFPHLQPWVSRIKEFCASM